MAYDKKQFLNVLAAGLCSKGRMGKQLPTTYIAASKTKKPVAYLYNGVRLPDINEVWTDKEKYPYAYIVHQVAGYYLLYLSNKRAEWWSSQNSLVVYYAHSYKVSVVENGAWLVKAEESVTDVTAHIATMPNYTVWANTDIYGRYNTTELHLAASDPIPVFE